MRKTAAFLPVGSTFVVVHLNLPEPPADCDWDAMIACTREMAASPRGLRAVLVDAQVSQPTSEQRERLVKSGIPIVPQAVLTSSLIVQGVTTALRWIGMGSHIRWFKPSKLDDALDYLKIPAIERRQVVTALEKLRAELGQKAA